jgi:hypothetical protein
LGCNLGVENPFWIDDHYGSLHAKTETTGFDYPDLIT